MTTKTKMIQGEKATGFTKGKLGFAGFAFTSKNLATGVQYSLIAPTREDLSIIVDFLFPDQQADETRFQSVEIIKGKQ